MLFPTLFLLIMLPIARCVLGSSGFLAGNGIAQLLVVLHTYRDL